MGASTESFSAPPTSEPAIDKFPVCAAGGTDKLGDSTHGVHCLTWISSCGRDQGILSRMQMACENASARGSHAQRNRISCSDWRLRSAEWSRRGSSVGDSALSMRPPRIHNTTSRWVGCKDSPQELWEKLVPVQKH